MCLAMVCILSILGFVTAEDPTIKTSTGFIRGSSSDGVWRFLGVPFAQPPIGVRRFSPPEPAQIWDGILDTISPPPACSQGHATGSEDCLYLNAFMASGSSFLDSSGFGQKSKLNPVIVQIHGGGFVGGEAEQSWNLTKLRSVVLFAIQYRLGVFGFFSPQSPPQNFGMQDQQLALAWVQKNAKAFGGDPSRVMIYGCSAGGASVAGHLVLPTSAGLFASASIASPGGHQGWMGDKIRTNDDWMSPMLNRENSLALVKDLNCSHSSVRSTLACMRNISNDVLLLHGQKLRFAPALPNEGQYPLGLIRKGSWNKVPTMIGGASCESCSDAYHRLGAPDNTITKEAFEQALIEYGLSGRNGSEVGPSMLERWYEHRVASEGRWRTFARILGDSGHSCSTALHAEALAQSPPPNGSIWRYFFDIRSPDSMVPGATHCSETDWLEHKATPVSHMTKNIEELLSNKMVNLAAHGDPNIGFSDEVSWSKFTSPASGTLIVTATGAMMGSSIDTRRSECEHWKAYFGWSDNIQPQALSLTVV